MTLQLSTNSEVWFLTGSQSLYGEETLLQVAEQSQQVVGYLNQEGTIPRKIVWKSVLTTPEAIKQICLEASANQNCIGVITWMHTFSPSKMWISGLINLSKPLLHLHTQANAELPWDSIDMNFMNLNQAAHGDREHGHIHSRINMGRKIVVGHFADPVVTTRIANWVRAAIGWDTSQNLKMARFGDNMRNVTVTDGDKISAQMRFGFLVEPYSINDLTTEISQVTEQEIDVLVSEYLQTYDVAISLQPKGEQHFSLRYAASIEVGMRKFLTRGGFNAFTTNFEDLGSLRQLPGIAVQRLMAEGYGFGGEGDWKTSALLRIVKSMSCGLPGGTSFMEDYTYHFGPGEPKVLGAHMLEVCPSITAKRVSCEIHPLEIGGREDPVRLVFDAQPAPGLVVCLTDLGERFRLIANEIEIVEPDQPMPKLPVAHAVWKPKPSLPASAECWIYAGGSHHTVLTTAVGVEVLQDFAEIAGVEILNIGANTDPREFRKEVRWNSLYFKLSSGI